MFTYADILTGIHIMVFNKLCCSSGNNILYLGMMVGKYSPCFLVSS